MNSKEKGNRGEDQAALYLSQTGYHIIKRNLRCSAGEVDIVVYKDGVLVFVEVKTWKSISSFDLERSIHRRKRGRIMQCARHFLLLYPQWAEANLRFDVVFISPHREITHFADAFTENGFL